MNAFATDIRNLIKERLTRASDSDILLLASALCANEELIHGEPMKPAFARPLPRFTKIGANGKPVAETTASDWVAVYDREQDLTWLRGTVDSTERTYADAMRAAESVRLFGATDWRAPTIRERLSIVDYSRIDPAIDTEYFTSSGGWEWTSTPAAAPSECAWIVYSNGGSSLRHPQCYHQYVRAVRAGQQSDAFEEAISLATDHILQIARKPTNTGNENERDRQTC